MPLNSKPKGEEGDGKCLVMRYLIRRDMPEVLEIESQAFSIPWTEEDFLYYLKLQSNCLGMVAEYEHKILGFMVYELHKTKLRIINFAVAPSQQRRGIGSQMIRYLVGKLSQQRSEIVLEVREVNLPAQLFFKERGFRAVRVLRNHYKDSTEDAYVMQYLLGRRSLPFSQINRISGILKEQEYE